MPSKKLGKGLGELLGEIEGAYASEFSNNDTKDLFVSVDDIVPNPYQPRKTFSAESINELADSIKSHGLLQPVVVIRGEEKGKYILIAGERRFRAVKQNGETKIQAIVTDYDLTYIKELSLVENIQREDLNAIEVARSYSELIEQYDITHEELSKKLKKSRSSITNTIRLLQLPTWIQDKVVAKELNAGSTKVLIGIKEEEQREIVEQIIAQKLPTSQVEKMVQEIKRGTQNPPDSDSSSETSQNDETEVKQNTKPVHIDETKIMSASFLLEKKKIKSSIDKNKLIIAFENDKEIDEFLNILRGFSSVASD